MGLLPSGDSDGESSSCLSPSFWWLRHSLGFCQSASNPCLCLHVAFPVSLFSLRKIPVIELGPTLIQYDLILI